MQLNDGEIDKDMEDSKQQDEYEHINSDVAFDTKVLLQRTMEALREVNPDLEDSHDGKLICVK